MLYFFLILAVIIAPGAVDEFTHRRSLRKVVDRGLRGDTSCGMEKTWYGWRVREHAESNDES